MMSSEFTPSLLDSVFSSATVCAPVSDFVWICQPFFWPCVCCTIAPLTPPDSTALCTWLSDVDDEGNVKTAPPLKSTLKDRPRTSHRHDADDQDEPGDGVPQAPPADEVERHLAAVEPAAELAEARAS